MWRVYAIYCWLWNNWNWARMSTESFFFFTTIRRCLKLKKGPKLVSQIFDPSTISLSSLFWVRMEGLKTEAISLSPHNIGPLRETSVTKQSGWWRYLGNQDLQVGSPGKDQGQRALLLLQETCICSQHPSQVVYSCCSSRPRGFDGLFWLLWAPSLSLSFC